MSKGIIIFISILTGTLIVGIYIGVSFGSGRGYNPLFGLIPSIVIPLGVYKALRKKSATPIEDDLDGGLNFDDSMDNPEVFEEAIKKYTQKSTSKDS